MADQAKPEVGYVVTVHGDYFAAAPGGRKIISRYKIDVKLPSMDKALSVIKNKLLDKVLKLKYSDYINFRTHELISYKPLAGSEDPKNLPLHLRGREQLEDYIAKEDLNVDATIYPELDGLRKAIALCKQDPTAYIEVAKTDRKEFEENKAIADLNPEIKTDAPPNPTKEETSAVPTADDLTPTKPEDELNL